MADNDHQRQTSAKPDDLLNSPAGKLVVPIVEDVSTFVVELGKEGDRSAVIVGATKVDGELEKLLKLALHPASGGKDDLFDTERPLSTFSAKITIAYRLGLIDRDLEHAIQLVRKIRNDFAHTLQQARLSLTPHRERVSQLSTYFRGDQMWKDVSTILPTRGDHIYLAEFTASLGCIIRQLQVGTLLNERLGVKHQCSASIAKKK